MSKKEQIDQGVYKTKAQLKKELPDDVESLKDLPAQLMLEKAALEKGLELRNNLRAASETNCHPNTKAGSHIA